MIPPDYLAIAVLLVAIGLVLNAFMWAIHLAAHGAHR